MILQALESIRNNGAIGLFPNLVSCHLPTFSFGWLIVQDGVEWRKCLGKKSSEVVNPYNRYSRKDTTGGLAKWEPHARQVPYHTCPCLMHGYMMSYLPIDYSTYSTVVYEAPVGSIGKEKRRKIKVVGSLAWDRILYGNWKIWWVDHGSPWMGRSVAVC